LPRTVVVTAPVAKFKLGKLPGGAPADGVG